MLEFQQGYMSGVFNAIGPEAVCVSTSERGIEMLLACWLSLLSSKQQLDAGRVPSIFQCCCEGQRLYTPSTASGAL